MIYYRSAEGLTDKNDALDTPQLAAGFSTTWWKKMEKGKNQMNKKILVFAEMLAAGLLVFVLTVTNLLSPFDYIVRDGLYQKPRGIDNRIRIIGIDEKTLEEYGPIQTWSRSLYGELLDRLETDPDYRPVLVGFDILFSGEVDDGDAEFAKKAAEYGNVVVVNQLIYGQQKMTLSEDGQDVPVEGTVEPYAALENATQVGYSNVAEDSDGVVRRILPEVISGGNVYNMFSKKMYDCYCSLQNIPLRVIPTDRWGRSIINYSGRPGDYECVSMADVLGGRMDTRTFKDCVIFVGAYAPGMQDNFKVPNGKSSQMYGVEIHANIFQSYLENRFAVSGNPVWFGLVTALVVMLLMLVFRTCKVWQSVLCLVGSIAVELFVCVMLNDRGHTFSVIYLPLLAVLSFVYTLGMHYLTEQRRRQKVLNAFRKYVAPQIVEELAGKGDFTIRLGGENRDIAVLFVDIRGFTTMSEALEPERVVEILNEYLSLTTKSVFDNLGTLDKFVGDATMAVFNSPFDLPDYEYKAVCAALDIVKGGEKLEKVLYERYGRSVGFGVGVNCGPAVVGNVGCEFRMDFTAIGDTVNTAARLEANAKKGQVLISDVLYERLKGRILVNEIGVIPLKGKSNGVVVYEVTGLADAGGNGRSE